MNNRIENIQSLNDFYTCFDKYTTIIFYGAGTAGKFVYDYCEKKNMLWKVAGFAVTSSYRNPMWYKDVSVLPLHCLSHFFDDALFVITTYEDKTQNIADELIKNNCKYIATLKNNVIDSMVKELIPSNPEEYLRAIYDLQNKHSEDIRNLELFIGGQQEIQEVHKKSFEEFEGCFKGREVVLLGTGPSLKNYKRIPNAIHIGVNGIWHHNIPVDFYFIGDAGNKKESSCPPVDSNVVQDPNCEIFVGKYVQESQFRFLEIPHDYNFGGRAVRYFYTGARKISALRRDISKYPFWDAGSICINALNFALYTMPTKIYIVGCDISSRGHSYAASEVANGHSEYITRLHKISFANMKAFAEMYYPNTEIISVNPQGLKGLFKDIFY